MQRKTRERGAPFLVDVLILISPHPVSRYLYCTIKAMNENISICKRTMIVYEHSMKFTLGKGGHIVVVQCPPRNCTPAGLRALRAVNKARAIVAQSPNEASTRPKKAVAQLQAGFGTAPPGNSISGWHLRAPKIL